MTRISALKWLRVQLDALKERADADAKINVLEYFLDCIEEELEYEAENPPESN